MQFNPYIFRNYDIRGKVPEDFTAEKMKVLGRAYGTFLQKRSISRAVVGRDCRLSGEKFQWAFVEGLLETGIDVIDIGMVMTQMVYFGQYLLESKGAAMITASHLPHNFNGLKLATGFSQTTLKDEVQEVRNYAESEIFFKPERPGTKEDRNIFPEYMADLLKRVKINKKYKVVFDPRNGTTAQFNVEILTKAGCELITRNLEIDGSFPNGTPDPTDERLMRELGKIVLAEGADLGLAFDADGDRIGTVDEKGRILWNDVLVAIFSQQILERLPGSKIIYNTLCSQVVEQVIRKNGGTPIMWLTGHAFIKDKIAKEKAAFGGELSGHFFFNDTSYGHDDGSYAALRVLEYLSEKNMSLSELYETFPFFISSPEIKIGCPDEKKAGVVARVSEKFKKDFPNAKITDHLDIPGNDGTRADFPDGMIIFRYSQNGPYITVKFEAKDQETYAKRRTYMREALRSHPEITWEDELCNNLEALL